MCQKELKEFGGIFLSPPDGLNVRKYHLCVICSGRIEGELNGNKLVTIDNLAKIKLLAGTILEAEQVEGSKKLLKLLIDLGGKTQQIIAGIGEHYDPLQIRNMQVVIVSNLQPRTLFGHTSFGMLLAVISEDKPVLLTPMNDVRLGSGIR